MKWRVVVAALVIQLCLGTVYAFSVFRNPLMSQFGWGITQVSLTFTLSLVFFTLGNLVAGRWQDAVGPRRVATIGGLLLGGGLMLASLTRSLGWLYLSYGAIAGLGIGFGYVTPIATVVKWFPHQRGLMTGLAVFGFGAGALVFAPLAQRMIEAWGVLRTFQIMGAIFLLAVVGAAQWLRNPPAPEAPAGGKTVVNHGEDWSPTRMLREPRFWFLWTCYLVGAGAGLMIISQAAPLAQELGGMNSAAAAGAVGLLSIFNGLGRLFWGAVSDKLGRLNSLAMLFALYTVSLGLILPAAHTPALVLVGLALVAVSFGGYFTLMPSLTADWFGTKYLGVNYGWVFTAYGTAAILGPVIIARVKEMSGGYLLALQVFAVMALVGLLAAVLYGKMGQRTLPRVAGG